MALKTRRHSRYENLRKGDAFLPFEARPLSKVPWNVPYFKQLIEDRRNEVRVAKQRDLTKAQYEQKIEDRYKREGWLKKNRKGEIVGDPWKMLKQYEADYRARHPGYESPWEPRGRKWQDFQAKLERTMARQRGFT